MQASFPRLAGYERDHGSVTAGMAHARTSRPARRQQMWSIDGGLQTLTDAIATCLRTPPLTRLPVRGLSRTEKGWRVEADGVGLDADAVILTCPAGEQARLLQPLDAQLAGRVGAIPYNRIAAVALGYRRQDVRHPLDGFGYLSPQRERRDVLGMQWCSSIFAGRAPDGHVLVRALCGGWHRGEVVNWEDARLISAVRAEMAVAAGVRAAPVFTEVVRWPQAIPQYPVGHPSAVAWIEARAAAHPGLYVGGNAYRGVSLNDCVEQGSALAARAAAGIGA
jgi:oxygen-dependent protoporphyrinogen oxidase